jgi:hypothetical protein
MPYHGIHKTGRSPSLFIEAVQKIQIEIVYSKQISFWLYSFRLLTENDIRIRDKCEPTHSKCIGLFGGKDASRFGYDYEHPTFDVRLKHVHLPCSRQFPNDGLFPC